MHKPISLADLRDGMSACQSWEGWGEMGGCYLSLSVKGRGGGVDEDNGGSAGEMLFSAETTSGADPWRKNSLWYLLYQHMEKKITIVSMVSLSPEYWENPIMTWLTDFITTSDICALNNGL